MPGPVVQEQTLIPIARMPRQSLPPNHDAPLGVNGGDHTVGESVVIGTCGVSKTDQPLIDDRGERTSAPGSERMPSTRFAA